jgi:4-diphosphocytidyl-2-C-methyl-D-erythritol kinase
MNQKAYAKINLSLEILDKREDGFHNLNSVMQQIDLYDELSFEENEDIIVQSQFKDDIILKTILKLEELFKLENGVKVLVQKNIPIGAGFGSASANAAAALIALNELWNLNLDLDELIKIGAEIGADVPFSLVGGCCFVSGKGEVIEKIEGNEMDLVLVNPGYEISTKEAYQELDKIKYNRNFSSLELRDKKDVREIAEHLHNDFIHIQKQDVKDIIEDLKKNGALNSSITGKGPAVFGIFEDTEGASKAFENLKDKYKFVYQTKTIKNGS